MDLATVVGLALGFVLILITMLLSGPILMFWDLTSVIVVIGGASASVLMRYPLPFSLGAAKIFTKSIFVGVEDPMKLIGEIGELAKTARQGSILALEKVTIENRYLAKAVKCMVDGYDPEIINQILDVEINSMVSRHKNGRNFFADMGDACPAFGMIGTVIGLVVIMANLTDPDAIGPGLAVALITTLYGALVANMIFLPVSGKLKFRSDEEVVNILIIKEGVNSILRGENPRAIQEKLESYLPPTV